MSRSAANGIWSRNSKLAMSRVTHLVVVVVVVVVAEVDVEVAGAGVLPVKEGVSLPLLLVLLTLLVLTLPVVPPRVALVMVVTAVRYSRLFVLPMTTTLEEGIVVPVELE